MTDVKELRSVIEGSGITVTFLAKGLGITRAGLYNKINGNSEFKISEAVNLAKLLHMPKKQRDRIFFGG